MSTHVKADTKNHRLVLHDKHFYAHKCRNKTNQVSTCYCLFFPILLTGLHPVHNHIFSGNPRRIPKIIYKSLIDKNWTDKRLSIQEHSASGWRNICSFNNSNIGCLDKSRLNNGFVIFNDATYLCETAQIRCSTTKISFKSTNYTSVTGTVFSSVEEGVKFFGDLNWPFEDGRLVDINLGILLNKTKWLAVVLFDCKRWNLRANKSSFLGKCVCICTWHAVQIV